MFVGETGVGRVVERACQLMKEDPNEDVRNQGGIDLDTIQKFVNFWYTSSLDLFGSEISSNAADYFAAGLKGRAHEDRYEDHVAMHGNHTIEFLEDGRISSKQIPLRNAMNEVLRESYISDNQRGLDRWNKLIAKHGFDFRVKLPSRRFNRKQGIHSGLHFDPEGNPISKEEFERKRSQWLPTPEDRAYVKSLMQVAVLEPGQMANWIAAPTRGINGKPLEFEYMRTN